MEIQELLSVSHWIDKNIVQTLVDNKYQQLLSVLKQHVNERNNQLKPEFNTQKNDLIDTIKVITTIGLTNKQERILNKIGILNHVGEVGVSKIEDVLFRNNLDIETATTKVGLILQQITSALVTSKQIKTCLTPLIEIDETEDEIESYDVIVRVHFHKDVSINNISDFKRWGSIWYDIGRGISMAHDFAPEDIKVIAAQKGSIIMVLAVTAAIATTTSTIILSALKVADRVLTIRKKAEEIKNLKLSNKKLEIDLEKEADKERKEGLEAITKQLSVSLNINQNGDGEKVIALEKSVRNLIDFVEKGGEVDFFANEDKDEKVSEDIALLKANFDEIKQL